MTVDSISLKLTTKNTLHEIAVHAEHLAGGLQNIAPAQEQSTPSNSVLYLLEISDYIQKIIPLLENIDTSHDKPTS